MVSFINVERIGAASGVAIIRNVNVEISCGLRTYIRNFIFTAYKDAHAAKPRQNEGVGFISGHRGGAALLRAARMDMVRRSWRSMETFVPSK